MAWCILGLASWGQGVSIIDAVSATDTVCCYAMLKALAIVAGRFCKLLFPGHQAQGFPLLSASLRSKGIRSFVVLVTHSRNSGDLDLRCRGPSCLHGRLELCFAACNNMPSLRSHCQTAWPLNCTVSCNLHGGPGHQPVAFLCIARVPTTTVQH